MIPSALSPDNIKLILNKINSSSDNVEDQEGTQDILDDCVDVDEERCPEWATTPGVIDRLGNPPSTYCLDTNYKHYMYNNCKLSCLHRCGGVLTSPEEDAEMLLRSR